MAHSAPPLPPAALAARVGSAAGAGGSLEPFLTMGAAVRAELDRMLGAEWNWEGKHVLDFGCGVGRVLRHFASEAERAEFVGCDIDQPSIAWVQRHLCPPFQAFVNPEMPPLDRPDESFDLVYAISVFTHLSDSWSAWLLEMHRVLKPGALLIATVLGGGMSRQIADEPWDPDRVGMNVLGRDRPWSEGGPSVLISEWWLRAHWGRVFEVLRYRAVDESGHDFVLLRRREVQVSCEELERPEPDEPRELGALRHNISQLHRESQRLRTRYEGSLSWRLTAPLRAAWRRVRSRIGR
jgi:SAM-dependent methyltransferase